MLFTVAWTHTFENNALEKLNKLCLVNKEFRQKATMFKMKILHCLNADLYFCRKLGEEIWLVRDS